MCMLTRLYAALLEASRTRISSRRRPLVEIVEMTSARASGSRTALEYRFTRQLSPPASPPAGRAGERHRGPGRGQAKTRPESARSTSKSSIRQSFTTKTCRPPPAVNCTSLAPAGDNGNFSSQSKKQNWLRYWSLRRARSVHAANRMRSCHNAWVLLARAAGRTLLQSGMAVPDRAGRAGQPALLSSKLSCPAVGQRSARRPASRRPTPAGADAAWPSSHRTPVAITPSLAYAA